MSLKLKRMYRVIFKKHPEYWVECYRGNYFIELYLYGYADPNKEPIGPVPVPVRKEKD